MLRWMSDREINPKIIVLLFATTFLNFYYAWALLVIVFLVQLFLHRGRLFIFDMPGKYACYIYILFGTGIGVISLLNGETSIWPYLRDIIRVSSVPLFWFVACSFNQKESLKSNYCTCYFFCGIYALISVLIRLYSFVQIGGGLYAFRASGSIDEYIVAIGVYLTFFHPPVIGKRYISNMWDFLIGIFVVVALAISFSRSCIIILAFLILCNGLVNFNSYFRFMLIAVVGVVIIISVAPEIFSDFSSKILNSLSEISSNRSSWTNDLVVQNWRGYEISCAKHQFSEFDEIGRIIGTGFGGTINAYGYAYLVTNENGLAWLHNGFYTALIKTGIIGVILTIVYYCRMFFYSIHLRVNYYEKHLFLGITLGLIIGTVVMHGVFWAGASLIIFLLMGRISIESRNESYRRK